MRDGFRAVCRGHVTKSEAKQENSGDAQNISYCDIFPGLTP